MKRSIEITSDAAFDALKYSVEMALNMEDDMIFDDVPFNANDIRKLAAKSDEQINADLQEARTLTNGRIDRLLGLKELNDALTRYTGNQ